MQVPNKRVSFSWVRKLLAWIFVTLAVLVVSGSIYQVLGNAADQKAYPPPGERVDIGGYSLHLYCQGEGTPTIILDSMGGGSSSQWGLIQPQIAEFTRVCAYDRAGFGWSDPGPTPRTAGQAAAELHLLVQKAAIARPYILVGHSYGANVDQIYANHYRKEIAGLILLDPGKVYNIPGVPEEINAAWKNEDAFILSAGPVLARLGFFRLLKSLGLTQGTGELPEPDASEFQVMNASSQFWDSVKAQNDAMSETSQEVLAIKSLGTLPLLVISANQPDDLARRTWTALNEKRASLSTEGKFQVMDGANHTSLIFNPKYATEISSTIIGMVLRQRIDANTTRQFHGATVKPPVNYR